MTEGGYAKVRELRSIDLFIVTSFKTRQLSYRKEDGAMRPIYGCTEKF